MNITPFIYENASILIGLALVATLSVPVSNLGAGILRRVDNLRKRRPTYVPGAEYRDAVAPNGGYYPRLVCERNEFTGVWMRIPESGAFRIPNRDLSAWVLPLYFDPLKQSAPTEKDLTITPSVKPEETL